MRFGAAPAVLCGFIIGSVVTRLLPETPDSVGQFWSRVPEDKKGPTVMYAQQVLDSFVSYCLNS